MSGGSYDYIYCRLKEECDGRMYDAEMDDMIRDLADVLHDLEWWQSADSSEDEYRATLARFKEKWFKGNREERLKGYIDNQIGVVRNQLYALIDEPTEPKSEWEHDHEILKAYSDGAIGVLDEIRAEIAEEKEHAYADFEQYKVDYLGQDWEDALDSLPQDEFRYGMERCIDIINKFKTESEERMPPERDCVNCVNSKDGHMDFSETCHNCMWESQFVPRRIVASDIKPDDEWMQEDVWDEIYKQEDNLPDINVGNIKESEDKE